MVAFCSLAVGAEVCGEAALKAQLPGIFSRAAAHYKELDAMATPLMRNPKLRGGCGTPHGWLPEKGEPHMCSIYWWTSGHYPGSLWHLYEATGDAFFKERAKEWTEIIAPNSKVTDNHDVGFIMYCSFGNARRVLKTDRYDALLVEAADSLSKRFNGKLGLIRSWGKIDEQKEFLVIPDNMMNLELLEWAAKAKGGDARFDRIARSHADVSMKNHFRADGGTYHVLNYCQKDGRVQEIRRGQGASCYTAWSRGQSWAISGYTMMHRETREKRYLDFAQKLADYAINHPNMPEDGIPFWDYGAPGEERDSSAGAIMASALVELASLTGGEKGAAYRAFAVKQLLSLASPAYFSEGGEVGHFLLKHGVGNKPGFIRSGKGGEVDAPLDYGDYYFLEALLRFRDGAPSACARAASGPLTVFADGAYRADIVLPAAPNGVERYAAEELVHHFRKAFGVAPEVTGEDRLDTSRFPCHIYVGATKAVAAAGLPVGKLAPEEHIVKTCGGGLYLLGGDSATKYSEVAEVRKVAWRGTLYAAYDFLENEMGVKWLWPGETGEVVPKRAALKVGPIDRRAQEPLEFREYHFGGYKIKTGFAKDENAERFFREQKRLLLRQRLGTRRGIVSGHSFSQWWKNYHEKHPEYFNLLPNGKRMPHRAPTLCTICVSEPGVWKQRVEEWRRWWATASKSDMPPYPWVNCCENDAAALCQCERCRSWDGPDPRFATSPYWNGSMAKDFDEKWLGKKFTSDIGLSAGGRWVLHRTPPSDRFAASLSDRYVRFYNEVAAEAKKYNPEAKAIGYAYANYIEPPLKTRVGADTVIIFVPRSYFPYDAEESANFRKQWGGWRRMGAARMMYRPNYMLACGNHPNDTARRILPDFAFAYTNGMFAVSQDSLTGAWSAQAMHLYAMTRAMRDPLRGYEKARADVLAGFGGAAGAVNRYFDMVEANSARWTSESYRQMGMRNITGNDVGGTFRNPNAVLGDFFEARFFPDCYAILDAAVRLAGDDAEIKARIEFLRKGLRDTELGRLCRIAQKASAEDPKNAAKKAAYDAAFKAMEDYRASVEGDLVCNYCFHANWERLFVGWPHKVRKDAATPAAPAKSAGKAKPAGWDQGE